MNIRERMKKRIEDDPHYTKDQKLRLICLLDLDDEFDNEEWA